MCVVVASKLHMHATFTIRMSTQLCVVCVFQTNPYNLFLSINFINGDCGTPHNLCYKIEDLHWSHYCQRQLCVHCTMYTVYIYKNTLIILFTISNSVLFFDDINKTFYLVWNKNTNTHTRAQEQKILVHHIWPVK